MEKTQNKTPINVITGFLGSGKTTVIMNLLSELPNPERIVWLKNEYGNINVDKELLSTTGVVPVEIMNGCLCCVLVGRLGDALDEIMRDYKPERIIIESSGTAYPAPIVLEISKSPDLYVDSVITVVDVLNFAGYEDKSFVAKQQSQFIDLIVLNKWPANLVGGSEEEIELEQRLDDVYALNPNTPKVKSIDGKVALDLVVGHPETERVYEHLEEIASSTKAGSHIDEPEVIEQIFSNSAEFSGAELEKCLTELKHKGFFRIKGVLKVDGGVFLLNWVFGKMQLLKLPDQNFKQNVLVFMGKNLQLNSEQLSFLFARAEIKEKLSFFQKFFRMFR